MLVLAYSVTHLQSVTYCDTGDNVRIRQVVLLMTCHGGFNSDPIPCPPIVILHGYQSGVVASQQAGSLAVMSSRHSDMLLGILSGCWMVSRIGVCPCAVELACRHGLIDVHVLCA